MELLEPGVAPFPVLEGIRFPRTQNMSGPAFVAGQEMRSPARYLALFTVVQVRQPGQ